MALTPMMKIKKDKEAVDKEMTQGATAHLVSLPSSPLGTPCPRSYTRYFFYTNSLPPDRVQDIIHLYSAPTIHSGYIALPAVIV